jgi:hypothetical protein
MSIAKGPIWSISKETLEEYINSGLTTKEIADKFGVCERTAYLVIKSFGLKSLGNVIRDRFAKFNIHKFDQIDTEEKSYWLGFLYADGCVTSDEESLSLKLSETDYNHVVKFKNFMEDTRGDGYIKHYSYFENGRLYESCRYSAYNKYFASVLIKLGCIPRKSLVLTFPDESIFSKKELVYDFIRGYIDGDGSISKNKNNRMCISAVGTFEFLTGITKYLPQFVSVCRRTDCNVCSIGCSANKADQVGFKLYENATIYLDRKMERYAALCKLHNSETSDKIGESCDANAEVTPEIAKGSESTVENSE